jgi:hypothetical protein
MQQWWATSGGRGSFATEVNGGEKQLARETPDPEDFQAKLFSEFWFQALDAVNWTCVSLPIVTKSIWTIGEDNCHDTAETIAVLRPAMSPFAPRK